MRTLVHILLCPLYLAMFIGAMFFLGYVMFVTWLFELDRPPTREEYYERW